MSSDTVVHGYVQIWNMKTGMSKSTAAFIETVEGKKKVKLMLYFNTGQVKTFQLSDNIKSVAFRAYGQNENHLHLTFQNNDFLFIERLSSTHARELKTLLDRVHQIGDQPPMKPGKEDGVFTSTTIQKGISKTSSHKVYKTSSSGHLEVAKERTSYIQKKMSLFAEKSSFIRKGLFAHHFGKRKRILASDLEMNKNEKLMKENYFKRSTYKINPWKYVSHTWEKQLKARELRERKKLPFESSFVTSFLGNPYLDVTIPHIITEKVFVPFFWETSYGEYIPEWDILEKSVTFFPEKVWQGLPNLGNTCYMNAVLQSLCSIPSFVNDLLNQGFPWGKIPRDALSLCLAQLLVLKDIYNIATKEKLLVSIKKAISLVADIFSGDVQNDAHEFLSLCLDQMKETMQRLSLMWKTKIELEEDSPEKLLFSYSPTKMIVCPVITNFEFEILRSIFCKSCGRAVLKTEPNNYLSINLPQGTKANPLSIQSTFDLFFDAEELEYKCEQCNHYRSIAVQKFSRLPRVLIVHLKRYRLNEYWSLRKDEQEVIIPTYLNLSSHCNENTKPPLPLSENAHIKDFHLLKIFQNMSFGILNLTMPATKLTSKSKDSLPLHIGSNKKSVPQKFQRFLKGAGREQQQKDLEKNSKLNIIKSELASSGNVTLTEQQLSAGSMNYVKDTSLSPICKNGGKPSPDTSLADKPSLDTSLTEAHFQEVSENTEIKKHEETNGFVELDFSSFSETTEDLYEDKNPSIPGIFQNVARQTQQCDSVRIHKQALEQALPQSLPKLNAQEHTQNFRPTELNVQKPDVNSLCSVDANRNPEDKDILDKTESKAKEPKEPKRSADKRDRHTYRLIGVISHIGSTTHSGHYITDAYDFKRHLWFTYNDLRVSSIQEVQVQKSRLSTGYIFFYMHDEIFEELLTRGESSQSCSTKARKTPQAK
uniref:ubiquitin carboxyl-terminal hydrolase 26 n=1 Tax=Urocitellus parryii TaxID=9999 RepID=UPI000E558C49|nr:ubiquitin carboxyl-terminal hydrolase 26 [Urocitellus parryii]